MKPVPEVPPKIVESLIARNQWRRFGSMQCSIDSGAPVKSVNESSASKMILPQQWSTATAALVSTEML